MKKLCKCSLAVLLSLTLVLCVGSLSGFVGLELLDFGELFNTKAEAAEECTDGNYTCTVTDGCATITGCDKSISGDIVIHDTLGGHPVTSIGEDVFFRCEGLTSVIIPKGVTNISIDAFGGQ